MFRLITLLLCLAFWLGNFSLALANDFRPFWDFRSWRRVSKQDNPYLSYMRKFSEQEVTALMLIDNNSLPPFKKEREFLADTTRQEKIAIVGSGPAGLACAYYLRKLGYAATIFEAHSELGGMLRVGIPQYRLSREVLDTEVQRLTQMGIEVRTNTRVVSLDLLFDMGYKAVFITIGAHQSLAMGIEGEDLPGVLSGIGFLKDIAMDIKVSLGNKVAVIGGGNTAMDVARTALRLGVPDVTVVYRRSRAEMPANAEEIEQAEEEGVNFKFLTAPVKAISKNKKVNAMECIEMQLGEPDSSGRRRPEPIKRSEFTMQIDNIIAAIGQTMDNPNLDRDSQIEINKRKYISVNEETMVTSRPGVFSGGDCTSGPATAVEAIGAGRRAARMINKYLNGRPVVPDVKIYNCSKGKLEEIDPADYEDIERIPRTKQAVLEPDKRKKSFTEMEFTVPEETALKEAGRCLGCGCQAALDCRLRDLATEYQVDDTHYAGARRHLDINKDEHPFILRDQNKCIQCGRCIRICDEIEGLSVYGFVNRGFETRVEPTLGLPLSETNCNSCGLCVSTCPTGALTAKEQLPKSESPERESATV